MPLRLDIVAPQIEQIHCELLTQHQVDLRVLRLDQIHPTVHGNKWFKLKYNLQAIQQRGQTRVLSFGGTYSNHIRALAAAGQQLGFETIGIIRGELREPLNPVLRFATEQGMRLEYVSRGDYRRKHEAAFLAELEEKYGQFALLPEGGANELAVKGCAEINQYLHWASAERARYVVLACGTGATMAGVITGATGDEGGRLTKVIGISVLKARGYMRKELLKWLDVAPASGSVAWEVCDEFHCGGYAKSSPVLLNFIEQFRSWSTVPIEPVYSGKLFYGIFELIKSGAIPANSEVLAIHCGGVY